MQMQQFDTLNRQQQPFIQSGYGAMGKLNTLLGLGARTSASGGMPAPMPSNGMVPTPQGGIQQRIPSPVQQGPTAQGMPDQQANQQMRLRQILALRAQNGDTEAARVLGMV